MAAAQGTTACCPFSSTSFETRGEMKNVANAMVEEMVPAVKNEYPASVSMDMDPMVAMQA